MSENSAKSTQVQGKPKPKRSKFGLCPWLCNLLPSNVPEPGAVQGILHPRKDVFVLKVAKIGATGDRRCKMELELVTPKGPEKNAPSRIDTRETQCDPDPQPCCCMKNKRNKK
ncbi:uncharacterized protein LOC131855127 [Achroia grisella]|uniref:uncharacterized protein LOC131855127 n=1 Tax=Achroia grisella TaxID=688607 RepID=UPI0027D2C248|nr:uncharacterized protein LOC131855127 [Achroia grisella]